MWLNNINAEPVPGVRARLIADVRLCVKSGPLENDERGQLACQCPRCGSSSNTSKY